MSPGRKPRTSIETSAPLWAYLVQIALFASLRGAAEAQRGRALMLRTGMVVALFGAVCSACAGVANQTVAVLAQPADVRPSADAAVSPPADPSLRLPTYSGAVNTDLQSMVQAALAEASRETGCAVGTLEVISAETVVWPDGSLGCPQPGMMYTQALVRGYRIRIDAGGEVFDYHASARGRLLLCPPGMTTPPLPDEWK